MPTVAYTPTPEEVTLEEVEYLGCSEYVGIGVWLEVVPDRDRAVILLDFPDSPAKKAGLHSHDSILAVKGEPIVEDGEFTAEFLEGSEGTEITVTVQTPGENVRV